MRVGSQQHIEVLKYYLAKRSFYGIKRYSLLPPSRFF